MKTASYVKNNMKEVTVKHLKKHLKKVRLLKLSKLHCLTETALKSLTIRIGLLKNIYS